MLEELALRNLGPICSATLAPARGMTAITGETGAGKSMLLSAVRLVSGGAAEGARVTAGANAAWAQAVFAVDPLPANTDVAPAGGVEAALAAAREAGVEPEDGELMLARTVPASGRSRAVLGGHTVPRSVLAAVAGELLVVHGQADQLRIASPARQREFLDMVAGDDEERAAYAQAWAALESMDARLERLKTQQAEVRQRADYLRESIARIERVNPAPGEDEELRTQRDHIEHAAEIAEGVSQALAALDPAQVGAETDLDAAGACELVGRAAQALRAIRVDGADFAALADRLDAAGTELADVAFLLSGQLESDGTQTDLDALNARIHELHELTLRWGPTIADVLAWRDRAALEVEDLDASPEKLAALEEQRTHLAETARQAAARLSEARSTAAAELAAGVTQELGALAMAGSRLDITVTARNELDAHGADDIAFLFTPFPGSPQLPMGKSASGGELSRLMLALELAAAGKRETGMTFIFDEVDAGVGGKAAVELGRRLARLARSVQVLVVTHLAQVASWADAQFVVTKGANGDGETVTTVREVEGEARVHEIARMLSGSETGTSLDHARELLDESRL